MNHQTTNEKTPRRSFIGKIAALAAGIGISRFGHADTLSTGTGEAKLPAGPADEWFEKIKGTHRVVFDAPRPHEIMPFAWPRVFLFTNASTGSPETDCGVVVVLRHEAICYAFEDKVWSAYSFGEVFHAEDPATKKPSMRNPFWKPKPGDFVIPGVGEVPIGINQLQDSGVMFCVCAAAINVYSSVVAMQTKKDVEQVKKEWMDGLLPGIQVVPSGVWALGRAQEHGCQYIFAG